MEPLDGQVAVVTGGAHGIGLGIATVLRREGANVLIADVDGDGAKEAASQISSNGEHAIGVFTDVADRISVESMASAALDRWGRIDILASNAGVFPHSPILQFEADEWDRVVAVNARGALFAMQACLPSLIERRYGRIVLTSSITGPLVGVAGYGPYGATKAALLGLMRSVALEVVGDGITINAVMPGNIRTAGFDLLTPEGKKKMLASIPMGVVGEPEDVAWAVRYLASAEARYVTGQTIIIDGGQVLPEGELD